MDTEQSIVRRIDIAAGKNRLTKQATEAIIKSMDGVVVEGCMGIDVREVMSEDVTLLTLLIDGSYSMKGAEEAVVSGLTEMIESLQNLEQADGILVSTWMFNSERRLVHGFTPVKEIGCPSYEVDGGTALYDTVLAALTGQLSYGQELYEDGATVRNVVIVFSDGEDLSSKIDKDGSTTRRVAKDLAGAEFRLGYVGFKEGSQLDEARTLELASKIAFPDVIGAGKNGEGIKRLFQQVTDAVIRVSSGQEIVLSSKLFEG